MKLFFLATQKSYLYGHPNHQTLPTLPDQFDKEQIRSYVLHLTVERKLSPNTMMGRIAHHL